MMRLLSAGITSLLSSLDIDQYLKLKVFNLLRSLYYLAVMFFFFFNVLSKINLPKVLRILI